MRLKQALLGTWMLWQTLEDGDIEMFIIIRLFPVATIVAYAYTIIREI